MNVIQGKITIIRSQEDYYKIKGETIIVAKNTHPDVVVAIDKIKAIITEIDNMVCHAAIIAREFNKPILMGIIGATKNFKNGDEVIVDFDNKIVKKIK